MQRKIAQINNFKQIWERYRSLSIQDQETRSTTSSAHWPTQRSENKPGEIGLLKRRKG
ncbi:hypothetical protein [Methanosphaerula palustris]|uniref:hypothetical protein n=1 Tax=Methanosphaerula palustris TaxID=475088 RepID=UPI001F3098CA|nr:hypothetical protein [Methanosphaerula palustris]